MRVIDRNTKALHRARAVVVLVVSVLALGWASLHGPSMALRHVALGLAASAADTGEREAGGERPAVTKSIETTALPAVRASSVDDLRAPRADGTPLVLVPARLRVSLARARSSSLPLEPPRANRLCAAKTHVELMVFLI